MSFKNKIALAVSVIVFCGLFASGVFSYMDTKKSSVYQVKETLQTKANGLNLYIDLWLKTKKDSVAKNAEDLWAVEDSWEGELFPRLVKYAKDIGGVDAYIGYEDGRMVLGSKSKLPSGYDPRKRPWYIKAKADKAVLYDNKRRIIAYPNKKILGKNLLLQKNLIRKIVVL